MATIFTPNNSHKFLKSLLLKYEKLKQKAKDHIAELQKFYQTQIIKLEEQIKEARQRYEIKVQKRLINGQKTKSKTDDSQSPQRDSPQLNFMELQNKIKCQEELLQSPTMKSIQSLDIDNLKKQMDSFAIFLNNIQQINQSQLCVNDEESKDESQITDYHGVEQRNIKNQFYISEVLYNTDILQEQQMREEIDKINNNFI